jgi:hypothetical protein
MSLADVLVVQGGDGNDKRTNVSIGISHETPVVARVMLEHGPGGPRELIRDRNDHDVRMGPRLEIRNPSAEAMRPLAMMTAYGAPRG